MIIQVICDCGAKVEISSMNQYRVAHARKVLDTSDISINSIDINNDNPDAPQLDYIRVQCDNCGDYIDLYNL